MTSQGTLKQLYRAILKLHNQKLPPPMKEMGDKYVRSEFSAHMNGKTTPEQWQQFTSEWLRYHRMLSGDGQDEPQVDVLDHMTPEQQSKMAGLYEEAQKLRESMIDDAFDKAIK